jgi:hypothetical protein
MVAVSGLGSFSVMLVKGRHELLGFVPTGATLHTEMGVCMYAVTIPVMCLLPFFKGRKGIRPNAIMLHHAGMLSIGAYCG